VIDGNQTTQRDLHPLGPADNLKSEADIRAYLIASFAEAPDDAAYIAAALGDVARARGMTNLAKRTPWDCA
jgi:probable addiction module antidote protein